MSRTRYKIYDTAFPYFFTCTTVDWTPIFVLPETTNIIVDSWIYLHKHDGLDLFGYVILDNHLHILAAAQDLANIIKRFKSFTARKIIDLFVERQDQTILSRLQSNKKTHKADQKYQLWQEGSHPQMILNDQTMWQKLEYIHNNPVKRGLVDDPLNWRYSSARNYAGLNSVLPVVTSW
ncbi:MAG: REP-associated tyrosine transposase [Thermoguttaceae bacterium]